MKFSRLVFSGLVAMSLSVAAIACGGDDPPSCSELQDQINACSTAGLSEEDKQTLELGKTTFGALCTVVSDDCRACLDGKTCQKQPCNDKCKIGG